MDDIFDPVAAMDQAEKAAQETARPLISFYRTLVESGMHEVTINEMMKIYGQRILWKRGA